MNEKALQTLYGLAQRDGYTKSFDEFKQLMSTNDEALNTMYGLAQGDGYTKDLNSFKTLVGFGAQVQEDVEVPVTEKAGTIDFSRLKKKEDTESVSEDGSSVSPKDPYAEQLKSFLKVQDPDEKKKQISDMVFADEKAKQKKVLESLPTEDKERLNLLYKKSQGDEETLLELTQYPPDISNLTQEEAKEEYAKTLKLKENEFDNLQKTKGGVVRKELTKPTINNPQAEYDPSFFKYNNDIIAAIQKGGSETELLNYTRSIDEAKELNAQLIELEKEAEPTFTSPLDRKSLTDKSLEVNKIARLRSDIVARLKIAQAIERKYTIDPELGAQDVIDYFPDIVDDVVDREFLAGKGSAVGAVEENVVSKANSGLDQYGFTFEETDAYGDGMIVRSANGKSVYINLNYDATSQEAYDNSEKLKNFLNANRRESEIQYLKDATLTKGQRGVLRKEKKLLTKEDVDKELKMFQDRTKVFNNKLKVLLKEEAEFENKADNFLKRFKSQGQTTELLKERDLLMEEEKALRLKRKDLNEEGNLFENEGKDLDRMAGEYYRADADNGTFLGTTASHIKEGVGSIVADAVYLGITIPYLVDKGINFIGGGNFHILPTNMIVDNYSEKFKDKAGPLWWILYGMYKGLPYVNHMKMFNRHLFANIAEEVEGYNSETGKFYRFLRLRNFLDAGGKISEAKMKNAGLTKAEQNYYRMYHGTTSLFHDHMSTKKGADNQVLLEKEQTLYIPNRKGSKMEFVIARNLAATFISFNYDGKLKLINVKGVNPLTGREEVHPLKDFINFYMIAQSPEAIKQYEEEVGIKTPKVPSDVKMTTELRSLQRQAKDHLKTGIDAANKKAIIAEEMESLTDAQPFNRYTHSRSAKAGYMASWDINDNLNRYVSENLFMHGLDTQKGFSYKGAMHLEPLIDGVIAHSAFKGQKNLQRWAQELWKDKYLLKQPKKSFIGKDGKKHYVDRIFEVLQMWTMVVGLALKPAVAVMNVSIGKINEYRRAGLWDFVKGERRFWGLQNKFEGSKKTQSIAAHFSLLHNPAEQVTDSFFGGWFGKFLFSPMVLSENYIQKAAFAGQLTDSEWDSFSIDEDGFVVVKEGMNSVEKGKSNEEVFAELTENAAKYKSNVYEVQGRGYTVTDQRLMQNYFILDGVLQFKRWFPTYAVDRLGGDRIDRYGDQKIGTLRAVFSKELVDAIREGGLPKEILAKLPKHQAEAINRALRGGYALTFLFLLIAMAGGMSDDDENSGTINSMWSLTGDIMLLMNISKLRHMITPPMITTGENILSGIQYGVSGSTYQRDTKYFDKGDSKAKGAFIKALPMFARKPFIRKDN